MRASSFDGSRQRSSLDSRLSAGRTHDQPERPPQQVFRVLLVDDDPATLMAMKHHLARVKAPVYEGSRRRRRRPLSAAARLARARLAHSRAVSTAESAADALALLKDSPHGYDLVLTGAHAAARIPRVSGD